MPVIGNKTWETEDINNDPFLSWIWAWAPLPGIFKKVNPIINPRPIDWPNFVRSTALFRNKFFN